MGFITWSFHVDWDDDGDYDEVYENITVYVKSANWSIGMNGPYQLTGGETQLTLTLKNHDKRFSPEYADGPYYGEMVPKRLMRVQATYDGTTRTMYTGWINKLDPDPGDGRTAVLGGVGPLAFLQEQNIRLPLLTDLRTDEAMEAILSRVELPPALNSDVWVLGMPGHSEIGETTVLGDLSPGFDLDTGLTTLTYLGDSWDTEFQGGGESGKAGGETWTSEFQAMDAIVDVVRAERGRFFFDRDGKAVFFARDRMQLALTLDDTFDHEHTRIDYHYGENVANDIRVTAYPRSIGGDADSLLWQLDGDITLGAGDERSIQVKFSDEDSGASVSALSPYFDETSFDHDGDAVAVSTEYDARGARITVINNETHSISITGMAIKGTKLTAWNKVEMRAMDVERIAQTGRREYMIDSKLMESPVFAQSLAEYELSRRKDPRGEVYWIEIRGATAGRSESMVTREIGDRIRVIDDQSEHDAEYFIVGEEHWYDKSEGYRTRWYLERADTMAYWILGEAGYSEIGETTALAL